MAYTADPLALAAQARRSYVEELLNGAQGVVQAVSDSAAQTLSRAAEPVPLHKQRDVAMELHRAAPAWLAGITRQLREAVRGSTASTSASASASRRGDLPPPSIRAANLSLVDNDTIEGEILSSRLALAMMDRASWEFTDLRSRMLSLERRDELDASDVLRPHVLARVVTSAWQAAGLTQEAWRLVQRALHDEFSHFAEEAYHDTNHWLVRQGVLPEIDLRPLIRRSRSVHGGSTSGVHELRNPGAQPQHGRGQRCRRRDAHDDARRKACRRRRSCRGRAREAESPGRAAVA